MLARTCNNIGKDQPLPAASRIAPRGLVHFQNYHHHQQPSTVLSADRTGKSSSPPTDNAKKPGINSDVATSGNSNRKDFNTRNKFVVGPAGVAVGRTTASPLSSSSSPPSASSAGRLPVRYDEATHSAGRSRVVSNDRLTSSSTDGHRNSGHPIRPTAVSGLAGIQSSRRRLPVAGGNGSIYDIYRQYNATGRTSPAPYSKTTSTVLDDGEEEDCNVDDSVDDETIQDAADDEMETGNRSIGSSMEAIEHMMRYVADVQAEAQRRGSVQRLLQQSRDAVAFQTALAAAAANASYHHHSLPQSALGLLGHSAANPLALGGGLPGRHLQSGGLPDPALYSALVAVAANQYHRQQQTNRGDAVNGASPTSTSSFCSPSNKDPAATNDDRDSPSMTCEITESDQQHRNHQQQQRHHRRHHVRHRSNVDDGFRVPPAIAAAATGNTFSGLLLQAAAAANGFPLTGRNDTDTAGSVPPLPTSTTPGMACNWMTSSGEFCGRRFGSSDELLHHLQSHVLQGHSSSTSPAPPSATDNHQLAAALAAGLFQSPLQQYHCANAAAAGLSSTGGIFPPGYPLLFGAGSHQPHLPPHLVAALANQGLASSLPSAAAFSQHRSNHHHQQQHQQQHRERSGTGKSPPPNAHGSSLLLHAAAAAAASRYHPYKLPQSCPAGVSGGAFSPLSRSGLRHISPTGAGPNAVETGVPSLAAYLSSSPYGSSLYPAQRLGPAVGP